jgi:hypothetical protein
MLRVAQGTWQVGLLTRSGAATERATGRGSRMRPPPPATSGQAGTLALASPWGSMLVGHTMPLILPRPVGGTLTARRVIVPRTDPVLGPDLRVLLLLEYPR